MPTKDPGVSAKVSGNMKIPELANSTGVSEASGYSQSHTLKTQKTQNKVDGEGLEVTGHQPSFSTNLFYLKPWLNIFSAIDSHI